MGLRRSSGAPTYLLQEVARAGGGGGALAVKESKMLTAGTERERERVGHARCRSVAPARSAATRTLRVQKKVICARGIYCARTVSV